MIRTENLFEIAVFKVACMAMADVHYFSCSRSVDRIFNSESMLHRIINTVL